MQKGREISRSFELNIKLLYDRCTQKGAFFVFGTMCSACAERDVHFVRDVCFASDVRFAREDAEHITSLCDEGAIHHCAMGHNITFAQAKTPLSSCQAVANRLAGKLMRKSKDCNRYYLSFTKNLLYVGTA